jgi:signal transduction histidine kinase
VSLGLIESHRGTIRLKSRRGAGTTVEIRIPVSDEPAVVEAVR